MSERPDSLSPDFFSLCLGTTLCEAPPAGAGWLGSALLWLADKVLGPAIVAVVFAGLTSFLLERIRFKRDVLTKLSDQLRSDLTTLQTLVTDYYARDYDADKDPSIETQIVVFDQEISEGMRLYARHSTSLKRAQRLEAMLEDFSLAVMDVDSFQSVDRKIDSNQLRIALGAIKNIRFLLTESKLQKVESFPHFDGK